MPGAIIELEEQGRLTHPLRWDAASDRYVPVEWADALRAIAAEIKALDPKSVVFYSSGRASLEASYMYALFARMYGNNNLPDSSNMCHESTSVGAAAEYRRAGRNRDARRFPEDRLHLFFRP